MRSMTLPQKWCPEVPRVMQRYDLTDAEEQVVVDFIKGNLTGSEAAIRLGMDHRQKFVNMFASIIQQWHREGLLSLKMNNKK